MSFADFAGLIGTMKTTLRTRGFPYAALMEPELEEVVYAAMKTDDPTAHVTAWLDERYPDPEE
jgi:hypothetical protein